MSDTNDFNKNQSQFDNQQFNQPQFGNQQFGYDNNQQFNNQQFNNQQFGYDNNQQFNNQQFGYDNNQQFNNQPQFNQPQFNNQQFNNNQNYPMDKYDYKPISMWGYFGYQILFAIPLVGLICLIIFSFGGAKNINVRNFARSYFCFLIVMVILLVVFGSAIGGIFASMY